MTLRICRRFLRTIFGELYPWAGQVRTVTISKSGSIFALPQFIASAAADIFARLAPANRIRRWLRTGVIGTL